MAKLTLGIIGGGQLGSLLSQAAKKLNINSVILSDDIDAPAKHFTNKFLYGKYDDDEIIKNFSNLVDIVTYEFENIPFKILKKIEEKKTVLKLQTILKLIILLILNLMKIFYQDY